MNKHHDLNSAKLSKVLENAPDCVIILDVNGKILWINKEGARMFNAASRKSLIGKSHCIVWEDVNSSEAKSAFKQALNGELSRFRCELRRINGSSRWCDVMYKPEPPAASGSDVEFIICSFRLVADETYEQSINETLTHLQLLNAQLRTKNERLSELDKMKSDFLNTVSHELRTPLTSLKWSADNVISLLADYDDENMQRLLKIIHEDSERLSHLIGRLLDFSRIEAGKIKLRKKNLPFSNIVNHCLADFEEEIEHQHCTMMVNLSPNLPEVCVDRFKIETVLANLLENSLKYTNQNCKVSISATAPIDNGMLEIIVADNGIGIPENKREKVFDKFYRESSSHANAIRGTGLGLAIAKNYIEEHGGSIWCESNPGHGSSFHFTLPTANKEL